MTNAHEPRGGVYRSEDLFRLIAERVEDFAIFAVDLEGRVASWNRGVEKLLGYTEEEFVGRDSCIIFTPEDNERDMCRREMETAATDGRAEDRRWHVRRDGARFWANGLLMALRDEAGTLRGFAKILRDETERKVMEDRLCESESFSRNILESITDAFFALDREWRFTYLNRQTEPLLRRRREDLLGRNIWEEFPEAIDSLIYEQYHRAAKGVVVTFEVFYPPLDSWFEIHAYPSPEGLSVYFHDINERKQAEMRLRDSEERYRTLFASIDEGFCVIEVLFDDAGQPFDYRFLEINPSFERLTGLSAAAALSGKTVRELIPTLESHWVEIYGRVVKTREPIRFVNGSEAMQRWFDVYAFPVGKPEDRRVALLFNNITERKQNEVALRESRERLQQAMDAAQIFSWEMNPRTQQVTWSDNLERVIGFTLPEDFAAILQAVHPEDRAATARKICGAVESGEIYESEFRLVNNASGEIVWVNGQGVLTGSKTDGEPRFAGLSQNITERKRAGDERERLLREAQEANCLKDEFLATLSHELRTPLTAILGWSHMLQTASFDRDATARALATIERNARAQTQLIDDLLDTSRIITGKLRLDVQPVDLAGVVGAATETAHPAAEAKEIRLQTVLDPQAGPVSGDPDRLQQVVWNLLSNAIKFTPRGGQVQIRLERINSHVEITVADTGRGIAPEFLPHVFDRFRQADGTTTRQHGGLGLGLSIVRHLVELHGGSVRVKSAGAGQGASFTVCLPLLAVRPEPPAEMSGEAPRVHSAYPNGIEFDHPPELEGLRVLVVDDEPDTRDVISAVLASCGAQVTTASSAAEALEQIESARPEVLVTDIGMPEEDGYALLAKVRRLPAERGGGIPAAALTAYARAEDRVRALRAGFQMHVPKPVEPAELITVVASLAGRSGSSAKSKKLSRPAS